MHLHRFEFNAMASACEISLMHESRDYAQQAADAAIAEVQRIERKYSRYLPDTVVSEINNAAGKSWTTCDDETIKLLNFADAMYQSSDGLFDITSGVFRKVWDFKQAKLPEEQALSSVLALVNWQQISNREHLVRLDRAGMEIDFGGFGKEYAADQAAQILRQQGMQHGVVNLAGDIHALGPKSDGSPWIIGIRHPRTQNQTIANIPLYQGCLATSGDYEKYFELGGKRYCHIIHPKTGYPVSYWQSVSIVAPSTIVAGALSTIVMLKQEDGLAYLNELQLDYFAVNHDGEIFQKNLRN